MSKKKKLGQKFYLFTFFRDEFDLTKSFLYKIIVYLIKKKFNVTKKVVILRIIYL